MGSSDVDGDLGLLDEWSEPTLDDGQLLDHLFGHPSHWHPLATRPHRSTSNPVR
jgi:hypothetical protein